MLMALLLPDPCDEKCPEDFKSKARDLLLKMPGWNTLRMNQQVKSDKGLRKAILNFIGDFANWDNAANTEYLAAARALVKAAHPEETPLVVDPFAGGGSIPLEALRIGCEAFASDLNPVACLILKVMLEDIPRHGPELAEELRRVGKEIKEKAEKELAEFYPLDPDGARPIAYLWARTVRCESPNCGAEIPLMRSFWLCKKANRKRALRYKVVRPKGEAPHVEFEIFEPKSDKEVPSGTVARARATCLCCGTVLPPERVRAQLTEQQGGADVIFDSKGKRVGGARMLTVVTSQPGMQGRQYRLPTERDNKAVWESQRRLKTILDEWERGGKEGLCPVPNEPLPPCNTLGLRVPNYGVRTWGDMFSSRQKVALIALADGARETISPEKGKAVRPALALAVSRTADYCSANCSLHSGRDVVRNTWARNALPIVWDFYESNPFGDGSGNFVGALDWVYRVVQNGVSLSGAIGNVEQADACSSPLPDESGQVWFTDPPYYNAIGYAESSDFFYVWLKRILPDTSLARNPFEKENPLVPKQREIIQDDTFEAIYNSKKDALFFEVNMARAFKEGRRITKPTGIASVVFAHKTTEGWESLLAGLLQEGWVITASWPIHTEMENKVSGSQAGEKKAMLLASIHLVCRPRPEDALVGDWADVLRELPNRVGDWMERLQGEGIRGADLVFACIGPALEIFSRYSKVETAEGRVVELAEYLEKVWEVVGRLALEQVLGTAEAKTRNGAAGAVEEDARLTALFLWTLQSTNGETSNGDTETDNGEEDEDAAPRGKSKGYSLVFDVVRRFAQPLGIHLPDWEGRIIETSKGVVRLMSVHERAKQLFGADGTQAVAEQIESDTSADMQAMLFPEMERGKTIEVKGRRRRPSPRPSPKGRGRKIGEDESLATRQEATTLDRVHAAMLLQSSGQANALRTLLKSEQERGPDFLRLANALSALYPKGSEEKRLLDAMLLAVPR